jgi:hypothetical protein
MRDRRRHGRGRGRGAIGVVVAAVVAAAACGPRGGGPAGPRGDEAPRQVPGTVIYTGLDLLVVRERSDARPTGAELVNDGPTGSTVSRMRWVAKPPARVTLPEPITAVHVDRTDVLTELDEVLVSDTVMVHHGTRAPPFEDALAGGTWYTAYHLAGTPSYLLAGSYPQARMILRSAFPPALAARADHHDAVLVIGDAYYVRTEAGAGLERLD